MIEIDIDTDALTAGLSRLIDRQVPYAASLALNATAKDVQAAAQATLDREFTIAPAKRGFMRRLIKIPRGGWATKAHLEVTILVQGPEGSEDRGALLTRHEAGGVHTATNPLKPFFIPADFLRSSDTSLPPRKLYPTALGLAPYRLIGGGETVRGARASRPVTRRTVTGPAALRGKLRTFVIPIGNTRGTTPGIYQRQGPEDVQLLWLLAPRITLPPRLHFIETGTRVASENLTTRFVEALARATA